MELVPLGPGFGVEVKGVTMLDVASDADAYKAVRAAFEEHSLLVFRDQPIADDIQVAFSRAFGPLELTKVASLGAGVFLKEESVCQSALALATSTWRWSGGTISPFSPMLVSFE